MRRDVLRRSALVALAGVAMIACGQAEEPSAARIAIARRLVGTWDATFWLDSERTISTYVHATKPVAGTLVFALDHYGRLDAPELSAPTNDGLYDADFRPFGFTTRDGGNVPVVVARVIPRPTGDSVYIVLSPGRTRFSVRMAGRLVDDSAAGDWRASAFSAGGGAGRFAMHRRHETL
ncbi:MAG TPA: hypothetical protein VFI52_13450 [Gemmatimonadaceae bacterium]|nr:hypothetical protein [Gemmatimonadaceae bacterium]